MSALEDLRQRAARVPVSASLVPEECQATLSDYIPGSYTLDDLLRLARTVTPDENVRPTLLAITVCLLDGGRLKGSGPEDASTACELATWIARSIAPIDTSRQRKDDDGGLLAAYGGVTDDDPYDQVAKRCLATSGIGLAALKQLWERSGKERGDTLDDDGLVTLIALSDTSEAWATPATAQLACQLLAEQLATRDAAEFLVESVLKGYLRGLFSKSRPSTVTASGRKAEFPDDDLARQQGLPDDSRRTKPWKYEDLRSIPVFAWALAQADASLPWPLHLPVLLALLDDPLTRVRARGLSLASTFLSKLPPAKLRAAGLAPLLEDAIVPTLGYLPSLTPEADSVRLLDPAIDALLALARRLEQPPDSDGDDEQQQDRKRQTEANRLRDRVLRAGVLAGCAHAGAEHPRLLALLVRRAADVLDALGVAAVRHLGDLVPLLAGVLRDPFVAAVRLPAVGAAARAAQALVRNCWPRLGGEGNVWAEEVLGMAVVCWVHLLDWEEVEDERPGEKRPEGGRNQQQQQDVAEIRDELRKAVAMLAAVAKAGGVDLAEKVAPLVAREPALAGLFANKSDGKNTS